MTGRSLHLVYFLLPVACCLLPPSFAYSPPPSECRLLPVGFPLRSLFPAVSCLPLLPATSHLLPATCDLLPPSSFLLPASCFLLSLPSFLLSASSFLLPPSCFLLPAFCFLFTTCFLCLCLKQIGGSLPTAFWSNFVSVSVIINNNSVWDRKNLSSINCCWKIHSIYFQK